MDPQEITLSAESRCTYQEPDNVTLNNLVETLRRHDVVCGSEAFLQLVKLIPSVAEGKLTTLILGETGTGKGELARALHYLGPRRKGPFVQVHCGPLSPELMENELFGHIRGSFTGADSTTSGVVASASGGVLFLDDIDLLPWAAQGKLLQLLEEGGYRQIGSRDLIRSDIWIITASNKDLEREVDDKRFREDLYYRISGFIFQIPPLRARKEDIPLLVEHFLSRVKRACRMKGKRFTDEDLRRIMEYDWPGNIRQLKSFVERYAVLPPGVMVAPWMGRSVFPAGGNGKRLSLHEQESRLLDSFRSELARQAVAEAGGSIKKASRILGVHRSELYRICRKYGISH